jgi:hypothetical protein
MVLGTGGIARRAKLPNSPNTFDLESVGFGLGPRVYVLRSTLHRHAAFLQANFNAGPIHLVEHQPTGDLASRSGAGIVSWWMLAGYKYQLGHFTAFVEAGLDWLLSHATPSRGQFSPAMVDFFTLNGGAKPIFNGGVGYVF